MAGNWPKRDAQQSRFAFGLGKRIVQLDDDEGSSLEDELGGKRSFDGVGRTFPGRSSWSDGYPNAIYKRLSGYNFGLGRK